MMPLGSIASDWRCVGNEKGGSGMIREDFKPQDWLDSVGCSDRKTHIRSGTHTRTHTHTHTHTHTVL